MKIIAGNWKLHKSPKETRDFFRLFTTRIESQKNLLNNNQFVFFPSASSWEAASECLTGSAVEWGGQNICAHGQGAFTGENSGLVLSQLGGKWVLLGHSERRTLFGESDASIAIKMKSALDMGLTPVLCVGETKDQRLAKSTLKVLDQQMHEALKEVSRDSRIVVAYEPVWAIGTGLVAEPAQVQEAHAHIHQTIVAKGLSAGTPILYGGSVKAQNAGDLSRLPHVNGFLVGGASLDVQSFLDIAAAT